MNKYNIGDTVTRNSYNNDITFTIEDIVKSNNKSPIAILKGVTIRIEATAYLEDLQIVDKSQLDTAIEMFEKKINFRTNKIIEEINNENRRRMALLSQAVILHLDGDNKYAIQSSKIYNKLQLNAIVKNIPENRQQLEITKLLNRYQPNIVIITGHDGMIKKGYMYNDINNYRNSRYFIRTVEEVRRWEQGANRIAVFAGACQSYYEGIMEAGANFASSPARILIDFMDPLIVAQKIAITPEYKYLTIQDVKGNLNDGEKGISGIGCFGKLNRYYI